MTAEDHTAHPALHRLLARQLHRLGLDPVGAPSARQWQRLLAEVSATYARCDQLSPAPPDRGSARREALPPPGGAHPRAVSADVQPETSWHALVRSLPDLVLLFDEDGCCLDILPQQRLGEGAGTPLPAAAVKQRLLAATAAKDGSPAFPQIIQAALRTNVIQVSEYALGAAHDDRVFEARVIPAGLTPVSRRIVVVLVRDVTCSVQSRRRLEHDATHDPLTGLANRRLLDRHLAGMAERAERSGTYGAVLLLDLDGFKRINDRLGHAVGDRLLQAIAARLQAVTRRQDLVARLGGDEFVLVLENLSRQQDASVIAQQICDVFATPFRVVNTTTGPPLEANITASIGTAVCPGDGDHAQALLQRADAAMYAARSSASPNSLHD